MRNYNAEDKLHYWEAVTLAAMVGGRITAAQAAALADALVEERAKRIPPRKDAE